MEKQLVRQYTVIHLQRVVKRTYLGLEISSSSDVLLLILDPVKDTRLLVDRLDDRSGICPGVYLG
jgi:hypothetical protein